MRMIGRLLGLALIVVLLISQALAAKNVIIMIGDGMGFQHLKAGGYYLNGASGTLCFEQFFKCSVTTNSLSGTTDSAAAATALATGNKAANGVISQAPDGTPYLTALEIAKSKGKRTGLVSTVSIKDATPAGFGAHEASRSNLSAVAGDYVNSSKANVIFGGGDPAKGGSFGVVNITQAKANGYLDVYNNTNMTGLN
ncbi:MAG: alkaline phosphatase, partial [bacterium]